MRFRRSIPATVAEAIRPAIRISIASAWLRHGGRAEVGACGGRRYPLPPVRGSGAGRQGGDVADNRSSDPPSQSGGSIRTVSRPAAFRTLWSRGRGLLGRTATLGRGSPGLKQIGDPLRTVAGY